MTKQSAFDKKHLEAATLDEQRSFLEELNLPPAVISFLRNNKNNLLIAAGCMVIMILGWTFYKNYTIAQNDKAAAALNTAVKIEDEAERLQAVGNVIAEYSSTDAAVWARLELAHSDYQASNFTDAITKYSGIIEDLNTDSNLLPLVTYSLAYAYEQLGEVDQALVRYEALSKISGFMGEGYLGAGRMYEKQGNAVSALEAYQSYMNFLSENGNGGGAGKTKKIIEDKLALLQAPSSVEPKIGETGSEVVEAETEVVESESIVPAETDDKPVSEESVPQPEDKTK